MNTFKSALTVACFLTFAGGLSAAPGPITPSTEKYHVMWTTPKGHQKCCTKKNKEKADRCAEKLRTKKDVTKVQVMAGTCGSM